MEIEQAYTVDRTGWPSGPWDDEPDKVHWTTASGLPGLIVRGGAGGNLCGYVGVPPSHPLHGLDYSDLDVRVHGGLTYSEGCAGAVCHVPEPGQPDDVWWFGFDCGHCDDVMPRMPMRDILGDVGRQYRTIGYVRSNVELLALQLARPLMVPEPPPSAAE